MILKKIKRFFFQMEQKVPYIPDFSDIWNILKILLMSFAICFIYSFSEANKISDFFIIFIKNLQEFSLYVIVQLIFLVFNAKIIKKLNPIYSILYLICLNFLSVYFVFGVNTKSFELFFVELESTLTKFGLSLGILFFFLIYFDWREKNLHPLHLKAQLSFLQSKMRPHFLFNTINSIVSLIKKEPDTAKKMLLNLSELLRANLRDDEKFMHTISEEVSLCKKYLEIEKIRLGERLNVLWEIQDGLFNVLVPKLSIQPLIENSILHGIQNLENGGNVQILIRKNLLSNLIIEIKNPKSEENKSDEKIHNNISMKNLQDRLMICFDGEVLFKTHSDKDFFHVYIELPIVFKKDNKNTI